MSGNQRQKQAMRFVLVVQSHPGIPSIQQTQKLMNCSRHIAEVLIESYIAVVGTSPLINHKEPLNGQENPN